MYNAARNLHGNARACVFLEPLFVIPFTMYTGYMTLYMLALGVTKEQVGMITSLGLAIHIVFALLSTYITDKLGRRYTCLIFDCIGWLGAIIIWAVAQNIYYFIVAAVVNSFFRVVANSWHCLMVEDSSSEERVHIFNFLQIAGILGGFFAPIGALLINRFTLVPAMRIMLVFTAISMFALFVIRHFFTTETEIGRQKMQEMKGVGLRGVFITHPAALKRIIKDKILVIAVLLRSLNFIQITIRNTFLAILVTERMGFAAEFMAVFHIINAIVMLAVLIFITPILAIFTRRWPISLGLGFHVVATVLLLLSPASQSLALLIVSAVLIALGTAISGPRIEALVANAIPNEDRSVANAVIAVIILVISTPFGFIGGILSAIDTRLPFVLTLGVFLVCLALLYFANVVEKRKTDT